MQNFPAIGAGSQNEGTEPTQSLVQASEAKLQPPIHPADPTHVNLSLHV